MLYTLQYELDVERERKKEYWGGWDTTLECHNWTLAESLLFLNQKALDV